MDKVLITGINGFVASHLIVLLRNYNYYIVGIDIQQVAKYKVDEYYCCDITDKKELLKIKSRIDYIIHLVALTDSSVKKNILYKVNVDATSNICELAKLKKINKIIYLSTVSVYSNFNEKIITEDSNTDPVNYYGRTKLEAENLIKRSGLNYTILRPTNIFGKERTDYKQYFERIKQRGNKPGIIFYRNRITHLLYVRDIVDVINLSLKEPTTARQIFIVADNEKKYSEKKLFQILLDFYNLKKKLYPYPFFLEKI